MQYPTKDQLKKFWTTKSRSRNVAKSIEAETHGRQINKSKETNQIQI